MLKRVINKLNEEEIDFSNICIGLIKDNNIIYQEAYTNNNFNNKLSFDHSLRIASISKVLVGIAIIKLLEEYNLSIDDPIINYSDLKLREDTTLRKILSHTSKISDKNGYVSANSTHINELLVNAYDDNINDGDFCYSNLNYGIAGYLIEYLANERFDVYIEKKFLIPLDIKAYFDVSRFNNHYEIYPLYRKLKDGDFDYYGKWYDQIDNEKFYQNFNYNKDYLIKNNPTILSPQGGLRISMNNLLKLVKNILNYELIDKCLLEDLIIKQFDITKNAFYGEELDLVSSYGTIFQIFDNSDSDRILNNDNYHFIGHLASAYGLVGGMLFDLEKQCAIVYYFNGPSFDNFKQTHRGINTKFTRAEEVLFLEIEQEFF